MARRILNRKELRADYDAAEERQRKDEDTEDEDEDEEEEGGEAAEGDEEAGEADEAAEEDEEVAPKKKKKAPPKEKKPRARSRAAKVVRLKAVWCVFSNSNQRIATYEYPKKQEADEHAARLMSEKKSTFYVQMVKEPMEEKKE